MPGVLLSRPRFFPTDIPVFYGLFTATRLAQAGQTYIIRLGNHTNQADSGTVVLTLNLDTEGTVMEHLNFVGPVIGTNRTFNRREPISGSNFSILAYNTMADDALETGEIGTHRTLWWEWIVPADGIYTLNIEGNFRRYYSTEGFSKSLSLFRGTTLGNLQRIAAVGHQWPGTPNPSISINSVAGEKLLIQVGSYRSGEDGPFILRIQGPESNELPVITSWPQANGQVGRSFAYQIEADNAPTQFAVQGLPQGLSLNSATGEITGVPVYPGEFLVSMRAKKDPWEDARILRLKIAPRERIMPNSATPFVDGWLYSVQSESWYYTTADYYPLIWDGDR